MLKTLNDERCSDQAKVISVSTVKQSRPFIIKSTLKFNDLVLGVPKILGHIAFTCNYGQQNRIYLKTLEDEKKIMPD